jgi:RimJ/RimL family protein N-acetyltransferase
MAITLRDATPPDESFLRAVYASTRADELSVVPWTNEQLEAFLRFQFDAQDSHYRSQYPDASFQIILNQDEPVGRLYVSRSESGIKIIDITIMPAHRNAGIGTSLLRELLAEAGNAAKVVSIWVEQFNPSQALFRRLGFSKIQDDGYNDLLQWCPNK